MNTTHLPGLIVDDQTWRVISPAVNVIGADLATTGHAAVPDRGPTPQTRLLVQGSVAIVAFVVLFALFGIGPAFFCVAGWISLVLILRRLLSTGSATGTVERADSVQSVRQVAVPGDSVARTEFVAGPALAAADRAVAATTALAASPLVGGNPRAENMLATALIQLVTLLRNGEAHQDQEALAVAAGHLAALEDLAERAAGLPSTAQFMPTTPEALTISDFVTWVDAALVDNDA